VIVSPSSPDRFTSMCSVDASVVSTFTAAGADAGMKIGLPVP
jgi:hypothetical protein